MPCQESIYEVSVIAQPNSIEIFQFVIATQGRPFTIVDRFDVNQPVPDAQDTQERSKLSPAIGGDYRDKGNGVTQSVPRDMLRSADNNRISSQDNLLERPEPPYPSSI